MPRNGRITKKEIFRWLEKEEGGRDNNVRVFVDSKGGGSEAKGGSLK